MSKIKGSKAERDIVRLFWENGWGAIRVAGSGSSHFPSPDIIARNKERTLGIECKITKEDKKYFYEEDIEQLKTFCRVFGAEPWIAIKFKGKEWAFVMLEDLKTTKGSWIIDEYVYKNKGLSFTQITQKVR